MKRYKATFVGLLFLLFICIVSGCSEERKKETINDIPQNVIETSPVIEEVEENGETSPENQIPKEEVSDQETGKPDENEADNKRDDNSSANDKKPDQPKPQPQLSKYPYYIKVNRLANCVTIYKQNENGTYTIPIKAMVCSVGNPVDKTPTGIFKTSNKYTWRYLYGNQYGQYATRINGPILFHSVPYKTQSNDSLKTEYYNNLGVADSMGCIRLTCEDAKWIYDNCPKGTTVEIYESTDPGPLGKPTAIKIDLNSPCAGWDPTDPNSNNPWRSQKPTILGVTDINITSGTSIDLLANVSASDWLGNSLEVTVVGDVDFNVVGEYQLVYSATDSVGNTAQIAIKLIVNDVEPPVTDENQEEDDSNEEQ